MVTSKRVSNARSERFYKTSLRKKRAPWYQQLYQSLRKAVTSHPYAIFFFLVLVGSGIAAFFMSLPQESRRFSLNPF